MSGLILPQMGRIRQAGGFAGYSLLTSGTSVDNSTLTLGATVPAGTLLVLIGGEDYTTIALPTEGGWTTINSTNTNVASLLAYKVVSGSTSSITGLQTKASGGGEGTAYVCAAFSAPASQAGPVDSNSKATGTASTITWNAVSTNAGNGDLAIASAVLDDTVLGGSITEEPTGYTLVGSEDPNVSGGRSNTAVLWYKNITGTETIDPADTAIAGFNDNYVTVACFFTQP